MKQERCSINLKDLKISNTLPEMIDAYKQIKRAAFENWCVLHYNDAYQEKRLFLKQISACAKNNNDPKNPVKVCIGSVILSMYSQTFRNDCTKYLKEIQPPRENVASEFIARYTAKHVNRFRTSSQFIDSILQVIESLLQNDSTKIQNFHAKNLLYNLAVYATRAIDKCTTRFYDVLKEAFCNPTPEIRVAAMNTLNKYFELTRQKQHPQILYTKARTLIPLPYPKKHGGILILISLIDFFPDYYTEIDLARNYMTQTTEAMKKDSKFSYVCFNLQIALASNFPDEYRDTVLSILRQIWPSDTSKAASEVLGLISFTLRKFPEALIPRINKLIGLLGSILSSSDISLISIGSKLMIDFMNNLPNEFDAHSKEISNILLNTHYIDEFVDTFKQIITQHDLVWEAILPGIGKLLIQLLDQRKSSVAVSLIAFLPIIPDGFIQPLAQRVQTLLSESDLNLRKLVPTALLRLSNFLPLSRQLHSGSALIASAMTDKSWEMRLAILNSFKPPYPSYLAYPKILEYFSVLANDESFKVRRAALKILGGLSEKNPAIIYPLFRRILLDILFLCESSKSMRVQSDATLCLPIIFSTVVPILPIYIPVFLPIAIHYLKEHLSVAANEKDDPHNFKTTPSYAAPTLSYGSQLSVSRTPLVMSLSTSLDNKAPIVRSGSYASMTSVNETATQRMISEEQMTFFERIFATKIAVNFIRSIGCICENSFDLIKSNVNEIATLLLETIGRAAHKSILLASIDTLGRIVDQIGPQEATKIPDLNSTLLKLGSRIISAKVYTAIFKFVGRLGPIQPQNTLNLLISEVKAPENVDLSLPREDFFVRAVVTSLFFVLDDKSEAALHSDAHRALSRTFSTCPKSINSQRLFKLYVSRLLSTIRAITSDERSLYFLYISTILKCPMEWLQPFSGHFFRLIEDLWDTESNADVLDIIPQLASALKDEFSPYMPRVVSLLLDALSSSSNGSHSCYSSSSSSGGIIDDSNARPQHILRTLTELSKFATNFIFIIIRQISETITSQKVDLKTVAATLKSIRLLVQNYNCSPYSSLIVRTSFHVLKLFPQLLKDEVLQVLYSLAVTMGDSFKNYIPSIQKNNLMTTEMAKIISITINNSNYRSSAGPKKCKLSDFDFIIQKDNLFEEKNEWRPKTEIDESELIEAISIPNRIGTIEQWKSWTRTFIQAFIKHSPNAAIQSCIPIAEKSTLFNRKIFNPAFLSCWAILSDKARISIQGLISQALATEATPSSVVTALIGLVEFEDRARMPIEENYFNRTKSAMNAGKTTFALHCAQMDFDSTAQHSALNIGILIQIYSQLGMFDEAKGMEKIAGGLKPNVEKLESKLTRLELSENWEEIANQFDIFSSLPEPDKRNTGVTFAHAFLHLKDWKRFDVSIAPCRNIPNAITMQCIHDMIIGKDISNLVQEGFNKLGQQGGPLFLHGFTAVAPYIVIAQQLVEIYEFSQKKTKQWKERLMNLNCHFNTIRPLLHTRMDILQSSNKTFPEKLSFLKLARKANEWDTFEHFFNTHFSTESPEIQVKYEYIHLLRKNQQEEKVMQILDETFKTSPKDESELDYYSRLYFKKAKWIAREIINDDLGQAEMQMKNVIELCNKALEIKPRHYRATNLWAWANMRIFDMKVTLADNQVQAAINAITGFATCVKLDQYQNTFFDLIQMISLLFRSTHLPKVFEHTETSILSIDSKRFIKVVPQLLVYQYTHSEQHRVFVREILCELLNQYPNSVIFPLLFVRNFGKNNIGVDEILGIFSQTQTNFYQTSVKILNGLQNVCVTLAEFFNEGLNNIFMESTKEETAKLELSIPKYLKRIKESLQCKTPYDTSFVQRHKERLYSLISLMETYMKDKDIRLLTDKKNNFQQYFSAVKAEIQNEVKLSIKQVAPELEDLQSCQLAVFSTFDPDNPLVSISSFFDQVTIKLTKQRPRKLKITGSDGKVYKFLLKGHEDLRLDQRMMQFFELMNSIASSSSMPRITITGVTPLTPNVGLIQWVPSCDTMNSLIMEMRQIDNRELEEEVKLIIKETSRDIIDKLRPIHRMEPMLFVCETTKPNDLRDIMWLKAQNAESWVRHTWNFAKTSALMSIVGYIIGLGDRHPANIMIQRFSGNVIHIDFGDCFEVTKERAQYAENIPFRLTRMMIATLGPCGIEGSFRKTCEETVQTIREHREAVMSILEIFIREPCSSGGVFENANQNDIISGSVEIEKWMNEPKGQNNLKKIISRISKKVNGLDFENQAPLTVSEQVDKLISAATDMYNLAYLYHGWNPLW